MNEEVWKCRRKSVLLLTTAFERKNGEYGRKSTKSHSCGKMGRKNGGIFQRKWVEKTFFGRKALFLCAADMELPVGILIALENILIASAGRIRMSADSLILPENTLIKPVFRERQCIDQLHLFLISRDSRYQKIRLLLTNLSWLRIYCV